MVAIRTKATRWWRLLAAWQVVLLVGGGAAAAGHAGRVEPAAAPMVTTTTEIEPATTPGIPVVALAGSTPKTVTSTPTTLGPTTATTVAVTTTPTSPTTPTPAPPPTAPAPTAPPPTSPPATIGSSSSAEQQILDDHNRERERAGAGPLQRDSCLDAVARAWAQHMAAAQSMTHNPAYGTQTAACIAWQKAAENVAYNSNLPALLQTWTNSPGHHANIVDPTLHHAGIGVAVDAHGQIWAVVDFTD